MIKSGLVASYRTVQIKLIITIITPLFVLVIVLQIINSLIYIVCNTCDLGSIF